MNRNINYIDTFENILKSIIVPYLWCWGRYRIDVHHRYYGFDKYLLNKFIFPFLFIKLHQIWLFLPWNPKTTALAINSTLKGIKTMSNNWLVVVHGFKSPSITFQPKINYFDDLRKGFLPSLVMIIFSVKVLIPF